MEAAQSLEAQPWGTPRRMGRGTYRGWRRELGRPSPARQPADCCCRSVASYNRWPREVDRQPGGSRRRP